MANRNERSVVHEVFTLDRQLTAPPDLVFSVWSDPAAKRRWFVESDGREWETLSYDMDFRVGGREHGEFRRNGQQTLRNDTEFLDIVDNRRIVFAYTMAIDGKRISASLSTALFESAGGGTILTYTEQAAYLDNLDKMESRRHGWLFLIDQIAAQLEAQGA